MSKLISFFLLPLYTDRISPEQFGNYDVAISLINLIVPIAFFQIWDGMYRISFDYKEKSKKQEVVSNCFATTFLGLFIYLVFALIVQIFFHFDHFVLVVVYGIVFAINYVYTYSARVFLSNKVFAISGVAATIVTALSNIILIVLFHFDVSSIYISSILGFLVQQLIIEARLGILRHFHFKDINKKTIKNMLVFSIPLCIATVSYWLLSGYTKILIQYMVGDHANGIYAVANKFAGLITLMVTVIQFAWNEAAYMMKMDECQNDERKQSYSLCLNIMLIGVIFGTAIFCLGAKVVFPFLVDFQYQQALYLIPPAIIGVAANSLAGFVGTLFMAEKKNGYIVKSTGIAAICNIGIGFISTKYLGLYGATIVLASSFILLAFVRVIKIRRMFDLKIQISKITLVLLLLIVAIISFYMIDSRGILLLVCSLFILAFILCNKEFIKSCFILSFKRDKK